MWTFNYQQLFYFWVVAREGGLTHAGRALRLSHPTLHAHVRALEDQLDVKLFTRVGRRLALTEEGKLVQHYANEIFSLGREMLDVVRGQATGPTERLHLGVSDAIPKLVVRELLEPILRMPNPPRIVCTEGRFDALLSELSMHRLDVIIADAAVPEGSSVRAYHHELGGCGLGLFAIPSLAAEHREEFPVSLRGAPMILPIEGLPVRRAIDDWLAANAVVPRIVAEFSDSALLKVFGASGAGIFPAPLAVQDEVCRQYGVEPIGRIDSARQSFYAITLERKLESPPILALWNAARSEIFAHDP